MFFFWQASGGEDAWIEALAESRQAIVQTKRPRYVTVLDLSDLINDEMSREQIAQVRYRGPLYFDWDDPEIEATIDKVNQFRDKLVELGVDPAWCRWYATGGRGFHCEVPAEVFLPKPPAKGVQHLPLIYREMAYALFTDAMDMRVYSARKGRMWRTPNVQRENGKFKVPVTSAEISAMTPEVYAQICQAPRDEPARVKAEFNAEMGLIYEKARLKVEDGAKKRAKVGARDLELLKRFKGEWPPTVARLMANDGLKAGTGFHSIAMQIAITSNAIGKSEEDMLKAAATLIEDHVSDGSRYNSPKKRRNELVRLYHYTKDNVCYSYSKGALKVLCAEGIDTADLDGMPDDAGERLDQTPADTDTDTDKGSLDLRGGIEMRETGLYKKDVEHGVQMISDISFKDPCVLLSFPSPDKAAELWGYEAEVLLKGKSKGRQQIDMTVFLSKQRYQEFAMKNMGVMKGSDNDIAGLSTILRDIAVASGNVMYVTRREGLDYVLRPESDPPTHDLIWSESSGVYGKGNARVPYIFRPQVPSGSVYESDIWKAPPLTGSDLEREVFVALFNMNDPTVIAPLIGWMTSCYHRMIYHVLYDQFPLLQVWGQAGSGKSQTAKLMAWMHSYSAEPKKFSCRDMTPYYLQVHSSSSTSIPLMLDEYKPVAMKHSRMGETLPNAFRNAYNNQMFGKGGEGEQIGQGWKSLSKMSYSAPILFIAEAIESEPAIMERTISVPVSKVGITGREPNMHIVRDNRRVLSSAGRSVLQYTLNDINLKAFQALVDRNIQSAAKLFKPDTQHRVIFNLGVILTGFDFFCHTLRQSFGATLDGEFARLRETIVEAPAQTAQTIMAEAAKVIDTLAYMSRSEDQDQYRMRPEHDYVFSNQAGLPCIDVMMQTAYVKYASWCRQRGQTPLYENFDTFCHGLAHFAPTINKTCLDSPLKQSGLARVYRFSLQKLTDEGVQGFRQP